MRKGIPGVPGRYSQSDRIDEGAIYWYFKLKVDLFLELGKAMEEKIETDMANLFLLPGTIENLKIIALRRVSYFTPSLPATSGLLYSSSSID